MSELYIDDNKLKYSRNPTDILKSAKKHYMKHVIPKRQIRKLSLLNFLAKFLVERKYLVNNFTFLRLNYL